MQFSFTQPSPFGVARDRVDIIRVARALGLNVSRTNFICCLWHSEKTPSCKLGGRHPGRFYCFGCHHKGDALDLICKVKGFRIAEALQYLRDLGYVIETSERPKADTSSGLLGAVISVFGAGDKKAETKKPVAEGFVASIGDDSPGVPQASGRWEEFENVCARLGRDVRAHGGIWDRVSFYADMDFLTNWWEHFTKGSGEILELTFISESVTLMANKYGNFLQERTVA